MEWRNGEVWFGAERGVVWSSGRGRLAEVVDGGTDQLRFVADGS